MVVCQCKGCGKMSTVIYVNEFDEEFCSKRCYSVWCNKCGSEPHYEHLRRVESEGN